MWLPLTAEARVAVSYAQEEATQGEVKPEHLFLGLVRDESMFSHRLLREFRCPIDTMRESLRSQLPPGTTEARGELPLSPQAKRAINLASDESTALRHTYIGSEHLLLGLLLLDYPHLQEMFRSCDISPQAVREKIALYTAMHQNLSIREKFAEFRQFLSRNRR